MLPPYIIEQIRKREEQERRSPSVQLPMPEPRRKPGNEPKTEDADRGVVIIDLG